ncbi:MAG: hemolysin III [Planctomycetaceae bacterium]|nr:hemolysin III [Planctomycetaceae bacterium]
MSLSPSVKFRFSPELANSLTHGAGALVAVVASAQLLQEAWGTRLVAWCALYSATLIAVYLFSTLSHAIHEPEARQLFRALDQGTIYGLIAGTYTPFAAYYLSAPVVWWLLGAMWLAAMVGFWSKAVAKHRVEALATWSYISLGWIPALSFIGYVPLALFVWIALGGVMYTLGTVFLMQDHRHPYLHAVWHLLVIAASACHYYAILQVVQRSSIAGL